MGEKVGGKESTFCVKGAPAQTAVKHSFTLYVGSQMFLFPIATPNEYIKNYLKTIYTII